MNNTAVSAYWWKGLPYDKTLVHSNGSQNIVNWADQLTPLLLQRFSHVDVNWAPPSSAQIVCIGSILGNIIEPSYTGVILGAGKLRKDGTVSSNANILALRGPLTAKDVKGDFVLGDAALLADELVDVETKKYEIGIVPHWTDEVLSTDARFTKYDHIVINPLDDPLNVVKQIGECRKIVSSSLHGLIVADSFCIPRRFEASAHWIRDGGTFKVEDYNAALGIKFKVGVTQEVNWNKIADLKTGLYDAFTAYRKLVYNDN